MDGLGCSIPAPVVAVTENPRGPSSFPSPPILAPTLQEDETLHPLLGTSVLISPAHCLLIVLPSPHPSYLCPTQTRAFCIQRTCMQKESF